MKKALLSLTLLFLGYCSAQKSQQKPHIAPKNRSLFLAARNACYLLNNPQELKDLQFALIWEGNPDLELYDNDTEKYEALNNIAKVIIGNHWGRHLTALKDLPGDSPEHKKQSNFINFLTVMEENKRQFLDNKMSGEEILEKLQAYNKVADFLKQHCDCSGKKPRWVRSAK